MIILGLLLGVVSFVAGFFLNFAIRLKKDYKKRQSCLQIQNKIIGKVQAGESMLFGKFDGDLKFKNIGDDTENKILEEEILKRWVDKKSKIGTIIVFRPTKIGCNLSEFEEKDLCCFAVYYKNNGKKNFCLIVAFIDESEGDDWKFKEIFRGWNIKELGRYFF